MFNFKAYFWDNDVYINEKFKYSSNEILIAYLNDRRVKYILDSDFVGKLKSFKLSLTISPYMDHYIFSRYNDNVYAAMSVLEDIDRIIFSLPPFDRTLGYSVIKLDDILNGYDRFFEDGLDSMDYALGRVDEDFTNEYGYGEKDDIGNYFLRLNRFDLRPLKKDDLADEDVADDLRELNSSIDSFFDIYIDFLTAYLQVHQTYKPFICDWLNRNEAFPTSDETARYFTEYNRSKGLNFERIKCRMQSFGYKSILDESGNSILCEEIKFTDLGSFLYYDFFRGIAQNYLPNRCKNCGKYFLIRGGWYYTYCDNLLADELDKTCRDIGSKHRYAEKCKNDPIWQTYNRAYKAHYARYMKKKMTVAEFEKWSRFASDIRDKALAGDISFEQYYVEIRK
ncbi:MAG: hypothetical protein HFE79_13095 [Ruminiclostridium sp.]|nr:hypothetical protein [Ruminiclostridium sp.]